jgi:iron complex outermembrane receptor protein
VKHFRVVASCACALALLMCMLVVTSARAAETADRTYHFDIPAEALSQALRAFGQTAGEQIIFTEDLVSGLKFSGLRGDLSAEVALQRLLQGTGLVSERTPAGVIMIRRAARSTDVDDQKTSPSAPQSSSDAVHVAQVDQGQTSSPATVEKPDEKSAEKKKGEQLQEVVVTGSRIPVTADQSAQDVKIYAREDIEQSGLTTVSDFLNTLPSVSIAIGESASQTLFGATTVQLRGLPLGTTLVLVNGRRLESSGISGAPGGTAFFDLNSLPLAAVERIEVLADGSSAIYGSDAIAGVVNIILKDHLSGLEVDGKSGWASDINDSNASLEWGEHWDKGSVSIVGSYQDRSELTAAERSLTASQDYVPYGGPDNNLPFCNPGNVFSANGVTPLPGLGTATYAAVPPGFTGKPSIAEFQATAGTLNECSALAGKSLIPATRRSGILVEGDYQLAPSVQLFTELMFSHSEEEYYYSYPGLYGQIGYQQFTVGASNPYNPFGTTVGISDLFNTLPRQGQFLDTTFIRPLIGVRGDLPANWRWEVSAWDSQDYTSEPGPLGITNSAAIQNALNSSSPSIALNPFVAGPPGPQSQLRSFFSDAYANFTGRTEALNGVLRGPLFKLPAGPLDVALGAEYDRDELRSDAVQDIYGTPPNTQASNHRNYWAIFGEARVPILADRSNPQEGQTLAATLAGRHDDYGSTFGAVNTPQFGIEWHPWQAMLVRATYSKAFQAPSLPQLYLPQTAQINTYPITDPKTGQTYLVNSVLTGGNPDLQPQAGQSRTIGFVYSSRAAPSLQFSVTFWSVTEDSAIESVAPQYIVENESYFPGRVIRDPTTGLITEVNDTLVNFGSFNVAGFDYHLGYSIPTAIGVWGTNINVSQTERYTAIVVPGAPPSDRDSVASDDGSWAPRWKGTAALSWKLAQYAVNFDGRYVGRYQDYDSTRIIGNFWLFDTNIRYDIGHALASDNEWVNGTSIELGGVNLFNRLPQYSNAYQSFLGYDPAQADIRGRFLYVQIRVKW